MLNIMLKEMPLKPGLTFYGDDIDLTTFFGFVLVKVTAPRDLVRPILIHQYEGRTIHPVGEWYGVYFSEEIKAAMAFGYKFEPLRGIEFTKAILFNKYVDHFYNIKKNNNFHENLNPKPKKVLRVLPDSNWDLPS